MRAVVLHSHVAPDAPPDELDVLVQADFLGGALTRLGWEVVNLPFGSDFGAVRRALRHLRPAVVVNLVETVEGTGRLIHMVPEILELDGIPYTGCPPEALFLTSHKVLTKRWLAVRGLPTPEWFVPDGAPGPWRGLVLPKAIENARMRSARGRAFERVEPTMRGRRHVPDRGGRFLLVRSPGAESRRSAARRRGSRSRWVEGRVGDETAAMLSDWAFGIVKPIWEDASVGIDQEAVVALHRSQDVERAVARARSRFGPGGFFVERFIDGREFNLALLAGPDGVEVLPAAEMCFVDFGPERHRIVDYDAKWAEGSFAESHTVRSFDFCEKDQPVLDRLSDLARRCWDLFGLRGYARVDFRVDSEGRPWILEINANPCLSPDAGFMAAARRAGLELETVVQRLLEDALGRRGGFSQGSSAQGLAHVPVHPLKSSDGDGSVTLRSWLRPSDVEAIAGITARTGFFNEEEIAVARELAQQGLTRGPESGYEFIIAEHEGVVVGFTCYGPVLGTAGRFDLYWIVVDAAWQGRGVGRLLLKAAEAAIKNAGGNRVYVETSSRDLYAPTRRFYLHAGYSFVASLPDFYCPDDHKVIYCKTL